MRKQWGAAAHLNKSSSLKEQSLGAAEAPIQQGNRRSSKAKLHSQAAAPLHQDVQEGLGVCSPFRPAHPKLEVFRKENGHGARGQGDPIENLAVCALPNDPQGGESGSVPQLGRT